MSQFILRIVLGTLSCLIASTSIAETRTVTLPRMVPQIAVARASGVVAAPDPANNAVLLYPTLSASGKIDDAISTPIGGAGNAIAHKQLKDVGYFLVTCPADNTLYVLNDTSGAVVKK